MITRDDGCYCCLSWGNSVYFNPLLLCSAAVFFRAARIKPIIIISVSSAERGELSVHLCNPQSINPVCPLCRLTIIALRDRLNLDYYFYYYRRTARWRNVSHIFLFISIGTLWLIETTSFDDDTIDNNYYYSLSPSLCIGHGTHIVHGHESRGPVPPFSHSISRDSVNCGSITNHLNQLLHKFNAISAIYPHNATANDTQFIGTGYWIYKYI